MITIYTDGACKGNPGPGGWAAVVIDEVGDEKAYSGGPIAKTTNQRMEVLAAIEGLSRVPAGSQVTLFSDSQYVVKTMNDGWKRKANQDLWTDLDRVRAGRKVTFKWVKGHNGHALQERADSLASAAAVGSPNPPTPSDRGPRLSHVDSSGQARMVDVTKKAETDRVAVAKGRVAMQPETLAMIKSGNAAKGDVLAAARLAGIMGAKKTADLIPLCHPLPITEVTVDLEMDESASAVEITATARVTGKTGVEMEALTAVSVAALTIYDMAKAVDRGMRIEGVRLVRKSGGKSGDLVLE